MSSPTPAEILKLLADSPTLHEKWPAPRRCPSCAAEAIATSTSISRESGSFHETARDKIAASELE